MIYRNSVDSEVGVVGNESQVERINTHKYVSTKKWEWIYLRVSLCINSL